MWCSGIKMSGQNFPDRTKQSCSKYIAVDSFVEWCGRINVQLNTDKTLELVVNTQRTKSSSVSILSTSGGRRCSEMLRCRQNTQHNWRPCAGHKSTISKKLIPPWSPLNRWRNPSSLRPLHCTYCSTSLSSAAHWCGQLYMQLELQECNSRNCIMKINMCWLYFQLLTSTCTIAHVHLVFFCNIDMLPWPWYVGQLWIWS